MNSTSARDKFNARFLPYARQSLLDWRARHPLLRAVEPLPMDEQTAQANLAALNLTPQQEWDRYALEYLLSKAT